MEMVGASPVSVPPRVRVLVADDHALLRHGIRAILEASDLGQQFEVVGEAADGREAIQQARRCAPDVVLLDSEMPGFSALEALRQIRRLPLASVPRVILLGTRATEEQLFDFLAAGAAGLLLKEGTGTELACALREVHRSGFYLSPAISRKALDRWHHGASGAPGARRRVDGEAPSLSERERQVLEHVAGGLANRQIAQRLSISVKTVEAHKAHMITRLGLRSVTDLVRYGLQMAHMGGLAHVNGAIAEN